MGRPRVRNRILEAARDLLETEGLSGLTTRAVAMHAGVTEASLFNNFGDKTGLLQALINEALPEQAILKEQITEDIEHIDLWLYGVFEAAISYFEKVLPIAASSLVAGQTSVPSDRMGGFYTPRQILSDRLQELKDSKRLPGHITPELTAIMLMGTAMHTAMTRLSLGSSAIDDKISGKQLAQALSITAGF